MSEDLGPGPDSAAEDSGPSEAELIQEFVDWVEAFIHDVEAVTDDENTRYWCPQWWQHPEAVTRLRALHQEYITAENDNTLSGWFVYHWDAHPRRCSRILAHSSCAGKGTTFSTARTSTRRV